MQGLFAVKSPAAIQRSIILSVQSPMPFGSRYTIKSRSSPALLGVSLNSSVPLLAAVNAYQVEFNSAPMAPPKHGASLSSFGSMPGPATACTLKGFLSQSGIAVGQSPEIPPSKKKLRTQNWKVPGISPSTRKKYLSPGVSPSTRSSVTPTNAGSDSQPSRLSASQAPS